MSPRAVPEKSGEDRPLGRKHTEKAAVGPWEAGLRVFTVAFHASVGNTALLAANLLFEMLCVLPEVTVV